MIKYTGFEHALIGAAVRCGSPPVAVYNLEMMTAICCARDKMTMEEAMEYIEFNVISGWLGEDTPWILAFTPEDVEAGACDE